MFYRVSKSIGVKILSLILCAAFVFELLPMSAFAFDEPSGVQNKLNSVLAEYPAGSYFSVNGKACEKGSGNACPNCNLVQILKAKGMTIPGQGSCWTCLGFATYVYYNVFGQGMNRHKNMSLVSSGPIDKASTYSDAKPGDIILFYASEKSGDTQYTHAAVFMGSTSNGVTLYDSNVGGTNKVHYETIAFSNIIASYTSRTNGARKHIKIYHANNYDEINGEATNQAKTCTVTFDANGGYVIPTTKNVKEGDILSGMPTPTRDGFEFLGWFTAREGSSMRVDNGIHPVEEDWTIYAQWKAKCTAHTYDDDVCTSCGAKLPYDNQFDSSSEGTYKVIVDSVWIRSGPYQTKSQVEQVSWGQMVEVVGSVINSYGNKWLKTENGAYIFSEKVALMLDETDLPEVPDDLVTPHTHIRGDMTYCDEEHPHKNYYECQICGEYFYDGSTSNISICMICNPPIEEPEPPIETPHTHVKGKYLYFGVNHPHYNYYVCASCGETFADGSTAHMDSCEACWGPWSGWSTTSAWETDTRQVETRQVEVPGSRKTEYRYGRYVDSSESHDCWCGKYLESLSYVSGSASIQYSSWSTERYGVSGKAWSCGHCNASHIGVDHTGSDGRDWWAEYLLPDGSYYWEDSRLGEAEYQTEYRYRERIDP